MSLRVATAAPFVQHGVECLEESEFVVSLSLDRDWFSPDQATRLIDRATEEGLLERRDDDLVATFSPSEVTIPETFIPDEDILRERSAFEQVVDAVVSSGQEKHEVVGAINAVQQELGVSIEAAAVVYAHRSGIVVDEFVADARTALLEETASG